jgi:hypothetical protein
MSKLFFRPDPFEDNGKMVQLDDIEITGLYGAADDWGKFQHIWINLIGNESLKNDLLIDTDDGDAIQKLQKEIERLYFKPYGEEELKMHKLVRRRSKI